MKYLIPIMMLILASSALAIDGTGTEADPYRIYDCANFLEMKNDMAGYYELQNDINCSSVSYTDLHFGDVGTFSGTLDGDRHEIWGLNVSDPGGSDGGLFNGISGTIKDIYLTKMYYVGGGYDGLLSYSMSGVINNTWITDAYFRTDSGSYCGIFAQGMTGTIESSYWDGYFYVGGSNGGGAYGRNMGGTIRNCIIYNGSQSHGGNSYPVYSADGNWKIINSLVLAGNYPLKYMYYPNTGGYAECLNGTYYLGPTTNYRFSSLGDEAPYTGNRKIESQLKDSSLYEYPNAVYDQVRIWEIENGSYPFLKWPFSLTEYTISSPAQYTRNKVSEYTLEYELYHPDSTDFNCTLYLDSIANETHEVAEGIPDSFTINVTPAIHEMYLICDDGDISQYSDIWYYDYDNSTPYFDTEYPSMFNNTRYISSPMTIKGNVSDNQLRLVNLTIFRPDDSIFWSDYQNLSNETIFEWNEALAVGNTTDGIWYMHLEAADNLQIEELPGLNPIDLWVEFEVDICHDNFVCSDYSECTALNLKYCIEATDLSGCNDTYTGDFTEFGAEPCVYQGGSGGGSAGGDWPDAGSAEEYEITSPTLSVVPTEFDISNFWQSILDFFENLGWGDGPWP